MVTVPSMELAIVCLDGKAVTAGCHLAQQLATVLEMVNVLHLIDVFVTMVSREQTVVSQ